VIALDASVAIAAMASRDPHHERALDLFSADATWWMHSMTLAEVLVGGVRVGRVDQLRERLGRLGVVEAPRDQDEALRVAELRVATGLKLPDCCVLLVSEMSGAALATFDSRLAAAARRRGIEVLGDGS
jgi:predicted nucleic acid-binding protein